MQTKNVSGRLLVGLRWWNEVTDEGGNWRFESLTEVSNILETLSRHWLLSNSNLTLSVGQKVGQHP